MAIAERTEERRPSVRQSAGAVAARALPLPLALLLPLLIFSSFLTASKFIPGIRNNAGPFEVVAAILILAFLLYYRKPRLRLRGHPIIAVVGLMFAAAALSQLNVPPAQARMGLIQTVILLFLLAFLFALYNLVLHYGVQPVRILRWITYAVLVVGPWVMIEGMQAEADIQAAGPFRNRAHMASYMLTAFWLVMLFALWPHRFRRDRWFGHGALILTLYAISVSGRRSVYLALFVGLATLAVGWLAANRGRRLAALRTAAVAVGFLTFFYTSGALFSSRAEFFQERVSLIGHRLEQALAANPNERSEEDSFFLLQRQGVRQAFYEHPILGIGWGAFAKSRYSPTGHEVHSTPLRFVAELGLTGVCLYATLMVLLLAGSVRLFVAMRRTPYGATYLALMVALWSLSLSYLYNRHITERTFWLLLLVYLVLEAFAGAWKRRAGPTPRVAAARAPVAVRA